MKLVNFEYREDNEFYINNRRFDFFKYSVIKIEKQKSDIFIYLENNLQDKIVFQLVNADFVKFLCDSFGEGPFGIEAINFFDEEKYNDFISQDWGCQVGTEIPNSHEFYLVIFSNTALKIIFRLENFKCFKI